MQLFFEVIEGDRQGARFQIKPGLSIGRRTADIILRDSKVSGRHAVIEMRENDTLFLIDNQSSNGIKIDGKRHYEVLLTPGVKVQIGRTVLLVINVEGQSLDLDAPVIETWSEALARIIGRVNEKGKNEKREIAPLNPLLKLKFLQGPQAGTEWTVGYGPRAIGPHSLDLTIEEPKSPEICFEIMPKRGGPVFRTQHPQIVHLNGLELHEEVLGDGDVIDIHNTRIQIVFCKED